MRYATLMHPTQGLIHIEHKFILFVLHKKGLEADPNTSSKLYRRVGYGRSQKVCIPCLTSSRKSGNFTRVMLRHYNSL